MATIKVTTQTGLLSALSKAVAGDTILLANGNYGEISLSNKFASTVKIQAEHDQGAIFSKINVQGASGLAFDGLKLATSMAVKFSSNISVTNTETSAGMLYFREVNGLTVDHVSATGGQYALMLNSVRNFSVTNSHFGNTTEDVMRITGNSYNGLLENNELMDTVASYPTHPDLLQFFGADGYTPHDITIRGNLFYDDPATGSVSAQGIFIAGPQGNGFSNLLVEDNLINVSSPNSIYLHGGQDNVVIQNNTLMPNAGGGGAMIRLVGSTDRYNNSGTTVEGNVVKLILDESGNSTIVDNYVYGRNADLSKLFSGTDGSTWENFLPPQDAPAELSDYGADSLLTALLTEKYGAAPEEQPTTVDQQEDLDPPAPVYALDTSYELTGKLSGLVTLEHQDALEIDTGAIGLTFNADVTSGYRGIVSIGAKGYGEDFSVWVQDGKLMMCAENESGQQASIAVSGITAHKDYDLLMTFDEEKIQLWLDDVMVGETQFDLDLSHNEEYLVIGGINGRSTRGTTDLVSAFFDGTISNLAVYDETMTGAEFAKLEEDRHLSLMNFNTTLAA